MQGTTLLITLAGSIALLLWGSHMISSNLLRSYGTAMRKWLAQHLKNRFMALLAGVGFTIVLQSAMAASLMASSLTATGILSLSPGLAVMLGANIGTTIVVQLLSLDTSLLGPILLLLGYLLFRIGKQRPMASIGQAMLGLGLMLLALQILRSSLGAIENAQAFSIIMQSLTGDPIITMLLVALLTWICHSSVAMVLLIASLSSLSWVPLDTVLTMVLGANLGGALPALLTASGRVGKRLPLGNLIVRFAGCVLCLPFSGPLAAWLQPLADAPMLTVSFHTGFNIALAILAIGFTTPLARLLKRLLPEKSRPDSPGTPLYLDPAGISLSNVGLANAGREALHAADLVTTMLSECRSMLSHNRQDWLPLVQQSGRDLENLGAAIRAYLANLGKAGLSKEDAGRGQAILIFVINLEHMGDIISTSLAPLFARYSEAEGNSCQEEISMLSRMQDELEQGMHLAIASFVHESSQPVTQLVDGKWRLRNLEDEAGRLHFQRLQESKSHNSADVYLRILRDYRRIYHHINTLARAQAKAAEQTEEPPVEIV